jgi:hypothetical protein
VLRDQSLVSSARKSNTQYWREGLADGAASSSLRSHGTARHVRRAGQAPEEGSLMATRSAFDPARVFCIRAANAAPEGIPRLRAGVLLIRLADAFDGLIARLLPRRAQRWAQLNLARPGDWRARPSSRSDPESSVHRAHSGSSACRCVHARMSCSQTTDIQIARYANTDRALFAARRTCPCQST